MFVQASNQQVMRLPGVVPSSSDVGTGSGIFRPGYSYSVWFVVETTGWTTGSCFVGVIGRVPGGDYFLISSDLGDTITGNGLIQIEVSGPVPTDLGVRLTPAGGFDGRVAVYLRTSALGPNGEIL